MLYSMTGFSRARGEYPWGTLTVELSSVNSRYLEVVIRASKDLFSLEPLIQTTLRNRLARGKVQVRADLSWSPVLMKDRLNEEVLRDYYHEIQSLQGELGGPVPSVTSLLSLPGVTESSSLTDATMEKVQPALLELLDQAGQDLIAMRGVEGTALYQDILQNLENYNHLLTSISEQWNGISQKSFEDYRERISKTVERLGYDVDPARLAQELVIQADKWDISEELTRSQSHSSQFASLLEKGGSVGRKLDFLLQEMNREANTIGSKVSSTDIRWLVVDTKTLLERIREQIQNVE